MSILASKKETQTKLPKLMKRLCNEKSLNIIKIRSDKGTEFINTIISDYCKKDGIIHKTSAARTPQQNGVAERRSRTLKKAARTMIVEANLLGHE